MKKIAAISASRTTRTISIVLMNFTVDLNTFSTRIVETSGNIRKPITVVANTAAATAEVPYPACKKRAKSVSYTHLDVYKRQAHGLVKDPALPDDEVGPDRLNYCLLYTSA